MSITYRPAVRSQTSIFIGLAGPSSSGKTFSALRLATGLARGGKIVMIDTESGRGLHYADQFQYEHGMLEAPFTPSAYLEAIQAAVGQDAKVIIVDSMSHEHDGPGGILEMHEAELDRRAGTDYKKREKINFSCWIKPKAAHNKFVQGILQLGSGVHVIFCFRAKQKLQLDKKGDRYEIPKAWMPICASDFQYETTALLMLPPGSEGKPDLSLEATKLQHQHKSLIAGVQIDEKMGEGLAAWADGAQEAGQARSEARTDAGAAPGDDQAQELIRVAREVATLGTAQLEQHWKILDRDARLALKDLLPELKEAAAKIDKEMADVPFDDAEAVA